MAIEKKEGLFYELMIRGNWDPKKGELGKVTTYQLQKGTALVDTEKNELAAPYAPSPAEDLTKDEAVKFLGEQFAGFLEQLSAERVQAQEAAKAVQEVHDKEVEDLHDRINNLMAVAEFNNTKFKDFSEAVLAAHNKANNV